MDKLKREDENLTLPKRLENYQRERSTKKYQFQSV